MSAVRPKRVKVAYLDFEIQWLNEEAWDRLGEVGEGKVDPSRPI